MDSWEYYHQLVLLQGFISALAESAGVSGHDELCMALRIIEKVVKEQKLKYYEKTFH